MNIRTLKESEASRAAEIEKSSLSVPWSECELALFARNPNGIYLVAEEGGVICGVCGAYIGAGECSVNNIAVDAVYRRRGIGKSLMKELLCLAKQKGCTVVFLEVASKNGPAISMYK